MVEGAVIRESGITFVDVQLTRTRRFRPAGPTASVRAERRGQHRAGDRAIRSSAGSAAGVTGRTGLHSSRDRTLSPSAYDLCLRAGAFLEDPGDPQRAPTKRSSGMRAPSTSIRISRAGVGRGEPGVVEDLESSRQDPESVPTRGRGCEPARSASTRSCSRRAWRATDLPHQQPLRRVHPRELGDVLRVRSELDRGADSSRGKLPGRRRQRENAVATRLGPWGFSGQLLAEPEVSSEPCTSDWRDTTRLAAAFRQVIQADPREEPRL